MHKFKKIYPWTLIIMWMLLIFYFSHQPVAKSNNLSKGITKAILDTVEKVDSGKEFNINRFNHILRKNTHLFVYLILGILVSNGLKSINIYGLKNIAISLTICVLYAISDEIHQLFVPGRGGQIKDVIIDSSGAVIGILAYNWKLTITDYYKKI